MSFSDGKKSIKKYFEVEIGKYIKNKNFTIYRPASLKNPKNNAVMFVMKKYIGDLFVFDGVEESLIFWPEECEIPSVLSARNAVVKCENPHREFARFFSDNEITYLPELEEVEIIKGAYIAKKAKIGKDCQIFPGAYIGGGVEMGNKVYIGSGVKLVGEIHIGNNVVIRENTVIGGDGLTTDRDEGGKALTIPQFGSVVLEDDVQIGANSVVARGAIDETRICRGAKIDSETYVSHNVKIDDDSFIVGVTNLLGSASVGKRCLISGNVTLMNAVHVGDDSIIGAGTAIARNIPEKSTVIRRQIEVCMDRK